VISASIMVVQSTFNLITFEEAGVKMIKCDLIPQFSDCSYFHKKGLI
jgi:hypothetical protein